MIIKLSSFASRFVFLVLSLCIVICISWSNRSVAYTIDTPYDYPVKPGTKEWADITTNAQMISVCQIPDDLLTNMTTDALLETALEYPLLIDIRGYSSSQIGCEQLSHYFNGVSELISRPDTYESVERKLKDFPVDHKNITDADLLLQYDLLNYLRTVTSDK